MATNWITLIRPEPVSPPANTPRVEEEHAPSSKLILVRSPKSVALPAEAIVTKSILLTLLEAPSSKPAANKARVGDAHPAGPFRDPVKFPKLEALPADAIVTNPIVAVRMLLLLIPAAKSPRVADDAAASDRRA